MLRSLTGSMGAGYAARVVEGCSACPRTVSSVRHFSNRRTGGARGDDGGEPV